MHNKHLYKTGAYRPQFNPLSKPIKRSSWMIDYPSHRISLTFLPHGSIKFLQISVWPTKGGPSSSPKSSWGRDGWIITHLWYLRSKGKGIGIGIVIGNRVSPQLDSPANPRVRCAISMQINGPQCIYVNRALRVHSLVQLAYPHRWSYARLALLTHHQIPWAISHIPYTIYHLQYNTI